MSAVPAVRYMTPEAYLEMEDHATEKHEYIEGEVFAMAGAGIPHNRIVRNTLSSLDNILRNKTCEVFPSDLKVHVKTKSSFVYPDLSIVCGTLELLEGREDIVTNPGVIIEVISPSTDGFDRGKKFMLYRQIPSLREYILISSMEVMIEKFTKTDDGGWKLTECKTIDEALPIYTINYSLPAAEIYRDVVFQTAGDGSNDA